MELQFQARWRGFLVRRKIQLEVARRLAEVRQKVEEAKKNATEEKKLCNRLTLKLQQIFLITL